MCANAMDGAMRARPLAQIVGPGCHHPCRERLSRWSWRRGPGSGVLSHLSHERDRSPLLRQAPRRERLSLGRDRRGVLRLSRRDGQRARRRRSDRGRPREEAKRSAASARDRGVRAARAQRELGEPASCGPTGARGDGGRGGRDDPPCPAGRRDKHDPRDMGDLHLFPSARTRAHARRVPPPSAR